MLGSTVTRRECLGPPYAQKCSAISVIEDVPEKFSPIVISGISIFSN